MSESNISGGNYQSISGNSISDVEVENGDVFIGNKYSLKFEAPKIDPQKILLLVQQFKELDCESEEFLSLKDELDDYSKPRDQRDIIGLINKLEDGGRDDLITVATDYKDKFAKRLSRYEFSTHHCAIHLTLLGKIEERFNSLIVPLIKEGKDSEVIDLAIAKLIVEPIAEEVAPADPTLNAKQIRGMIFLLTGNCYIRWSQS